MKAIFITFLSTFLVSSAFAQESATGVPPKDTTEKTTTSKMSKKTPAPTIMASKGIRINLFKPFYRFRVDIEKNDKSYRSSADSFDSKIGVGVGYAYIRMKNFGVLGSASIIDIEGENQFYRIDANATYAISSLIHFYGGLNVSGLLDNKDGDDLEFQPSLGAQIGAGLQFTKNFGAQVQLVMLRQTMKTPFIKANDIDAELQSTGIDIGLTATF